MAETVRLFWLATKQYPGYPVAFLRPQPAAAAEASSSARREMGGEVTFPILLRGLKSRLPVEQASSPMSFSYPGNGNRPKLCSGLYQGTT